MDKMLFEKKPFYSPSEIADIFEVHPTTVRVWISEGKLYAVKLSERITRIPYGAVIELLGEPFAIERVELNVEEAENEKAIVRREVQ